MNKMRNFIPVWGGLLLLLVVAGGISSVGAQSKTLSRPVVRAAHEVHQQKSIDCDACHGLTVEDATAMKQNVRSMKTCLDCHRKQPRDVMACKTCHPVSPDGRLKPAPDGEPLLPPVWMKGPTHGIDWAGAHAAVAGADSRFCANCHREKDCTDCHTGRMRRKQIHPADWLATHGTHSTMDNPRCMNCHRTQGQCLSCHRRAGVAPDAPTSRRGQRRDRFHGGASPARICSRARTNVAACASCHSESSCTACHGAINPHPVGFSRRCKTLARQNSRACAKCHSGNAASRCQ